MFGEPIYEIEGAEMFLSSDNEGNVLFLSNKKSFDSNSDGDPGINFTRLISPTVVKKMSLKVLKQLRSLNFNENSSGSRTSL